MELAASLDDVVRTATRLLGEPLTVDADLSFSTRAVVARVGQPDGGTLVVKRPAEELGFRRELAAYEALPAGTRADLLAHGEGILVMEDLGTGPSLADLLLGSDAEAAQAGLLAWARGVGRMAAATLGRAPTEGELFPGRGDIDASRTLALANELGLRRQPIAAEVREIVALLDPPGVRSRWRRRWLPSSATSTLRHSITPRCWPAHGSCSTRLRRSGSAPKITLRARPYR